MMVSTGLALAMMKLFEVEIATISAYTAGLPLAASAMLIAIGTMMTAAPTLETTCEKNSASTAITACSAHCGQEPRWRSTSCAIQAAVPVESIAQPSGIRQARVKMVFQLIAWYASSMSRTTEHSMPNAPVRHEPEGL